MKEITFIFIAMACKKLPSPIILQRASKAVLTSKCPLTDDLYTKLKRHRKILRKLANMKGTMTQKQAFVKRNRKQIGGIIPLLPLIVSAVSSAVGPLIEHLLHK